MFRYACPLAQGVGVKCCLSVTCFALCCLRGLCVDVAKCCLCHWSCLVLSCPCVQPVCSHTKGSGSYVHFCQRPCLSTCRWSRLATHRHWGPLCVSPVISCPLCLTPFKSENHDPKNWRLFILRHRCPLRVFQRVFSTPPGATCAESRLPLMITEQLLPEINSEQPPFSDQLQKLIQTALESVSVTSK